MPHDAPRAFERVVECVLQAVCFRMSDLYCPVLEPETMGGNVRWCTMKGTLDACPSTVWMQLFESSQGFVGFVVTGRNHVVAVVVFGGGHAAFFASVEDECWCGVGY